MIASMLLQQLLTALLMLTNRFVVLQLPYF